MENEKTIFSFSEFICICKQLPIQFYLYGIKLQQQPPPRKDPAIIQRKPQQSNDPYEHAFGESGKEELLFNRKKPLIGPGSGRRWDTGQKRKHIL